MRKYRVAEVFCSPQGEGARAGVLHVFVRFAGCNLACSKEAEGFDCDTDFSNGRNLDAAGLVDEVREAGGACRWVLLTGGEPALQADAELVEALHEAGYRVAVETNGTRALPASVDWVSVSPKTAEHALRVGRADELRYVRAARQELPKPSLKVPDERLFVSPAFEPEGRPTVETLRWCLELVRRDPRWRLSMQAHKLLGLR